MKHFATLYNRLYWKEEGKEKYAFATHSILKGSCTFSAICTFRFTGLENCSFLHYAISSWSILQLSVLPPFLFISYQYPFTNFPFTLVTHIDCHEHNLHWSHAYLPWPSLHLWGYVELCTLLVEGHRTRTHVRGYAHVHIGVSERSLETPIAVCCEDGGQMTIVCQ